MTNKRPVRFFQFKILRIFTLADAMIWRISWEGIVIVSDRKSRPGKIDPVPVFPSTNDFNLYRRMICLTDILQIETLSLHFWIFREHASEEILFLLFFQIVIIWQNSVKEGDVSGRLRGKITSFAASQITILKFISQERLKRIFIWIARCLFFNPQASVAQKIAD